MTRLFPKRAQGWGEKRPSITAGAITDARADIVLSFPALTQNQAPHSIQLERSFSKERRLEENSNFIATQQRPLLPKVEQWHHRTNQQTTLRYLIQLCVSVFPENTTNPLGFTTLSSALNSACTPSRLNCHTRRCRQPSGKILIAFLFTVVVSENHYVNGLGMITSSISEIHMLREQELDATKAFLNALKVGYTILEKSNTMI